MWPFLEKASPQPSQNTAKETELASQPATCAALVPRALGRPGGELHGAPKRSLPGRTAELRGKETARAGF